MTWRPELRLGSVALGLWLCGQASVWSETLTPSQLSPVEAIQQALQAEDYEEAISLLLALIARSERPAAELAPLYYQLGLAYYQLQLYALALDAFEDAFQRWPDPPPQLFFSLGMCYYYNRSLDQAQDMLNRVILDNRSPAALRLQAEEQLLLTLRDQSGTYQQGLNAYQEGRFEAAVQAFTEALRLLPQSVELHYYLGASLIQLQNYESARFHFDRVIALKPDSELAQKARLTLEVIDRLGQNLPQKPFFGSLTLGGLGDSNVNFGGPTDNTTRAPNSSSLAQNLQDAGLLLNFSVGYQWLPEWGVRYHLYLQQYLGWPHSSSAPSSSDFNLQIHSLSLQNRFSLSDQLELSLNTQSGFQWLGSRPFLWDASLRPSLTWYLNERLVSRFNASLGGELYPDFNERDNLNHQLGLEQFLYLWNSQTWLRMGYDWQQVYARDQRQSTLLEVGGNRFEVEYRFTNSRVAHQLGLGLGFPLGPIQLEVGGRFDFIDYTLPDQVQQYLIRVNPLTGLPLPRQELSSNTVEKWRSDTRLSVYLQFDWPLRRDLKLQGRYTRTTNVSNITPEDYSLSRSYLKDVFNLGLRWEF